ncbi:MAG: DUF4886 domain-containing protein, partial [Chloroflexota bacterium]
QHLDDLENEADNPVLRQYLVTGSGQLREWDLVVVQGQSQISGLDNAHPQKQEQLAALPEIMRYVEANPRTTPMLMMTWGYADGDPLNPQRFTSYTEMQRYLWTGYEELAGVASRISLTAETFVAPAGLGYQLVYEDLRDAGEDPLAANSRFRQLYHPDMRHPGLPGTYLAANIVTGSYTGQRTAELTFVPANLDPEFAAYLREVADRVVFGDRFGVRDYPWR